MYYVFPILFIFIALAVYQFLRSRHAVFKFLKIPGPTPTLLVGNLFQLFQNKEKPACQVLDEWTKEFGKVFGYYEGPKPVLTVSDPDIVQDVLIKKFSHFHSRKVFPLGPDPDKSPRVHLFTARGTRWKRLRVITNPAFTASKLKLMSHTMNDCVSILLQNLGKIAKTEQPFDAWKLYQGLTMDVIARCGYGIQTNCQLNEKDEFLNRGRDVFNRTTVPLFSYLAIVLPELKKVWGFLGEITSRFRGIPFPYLKEMLTDVINKRKDMANKDQKASKSVDLIQLMLNAELTDKETKELLAAAKPDDETYNAAGHSVSRHLGKKEILEQSILFLLAGFETSSNALSYITYLLATNPDVQEKLQNEVDLNFPKESDRRDLVDKDELRRYMPHLHQRYLRVHRHKIIPTYDSVSNLPYMDMVIDESMRLYPVGAPVVNRDCMETCSIGQYIVPKGMAVQVNVWTIHHDPEIWGDNVEEFIPERFSQEEVEKRHPCAFLPFGGGPRNCIGMRFALLEIKIALVRIVQNYSFRQCDKTQIPLKLKQTLTIQPKEGVFVIVEQR